MKVKVCTEEFLKDTERISPDMLHGDILHAESGYYSNYRILLRMELEPGDPGVANEHEWEVWQDFVIDALITPFDAWVEDDYLMDVDLSAPFMFEFGTQADAEALLEDIRKHEGVYKMDKPFKKYVFPLIKQNAGDLHKISLLEDFPLALSKDMAEKYCNGDSGKPYCGMTQTFGIYDAYEKDLVAVMTATFMRVFPHPDSPSGKIVHISGAYTHPDYRHLGYASRLLEFIEAVSKKLYGADYICADAVAKELFTNNGYMISRGATRVWRRI